jgi:hypothetical protein
MTAKKAWIYCTFGAAGFIFYASQVYAQSNWNEASTLKQSQNLNAQGQMAAVERNSNVSDESDKAHTQQNSEVGKTESQQAVRDGQHDFDPLMGAWKYHLRRRLHPLTGSNSWVELDGTGVCFKVWDGRAELDTIEVDGPTGHIEGLTLRMYNPQSHQWRLYWANSKNGIMDPPQIGEFKNGRGEFFAQDTIDGKTVFIRSVWTDMTTNSPHFEQSFSDDGGKTWEVNWITDQTRVPDESDRSH